MVAPLAGLREPPRDAGSQGDSSSNTAAKTGSRSTKRQECPLCLISAGSLPAHQPASPSPGTPQALQPAAPGSPGPQPGQLGPVLSTVAAASVQGRPRQPTRQGPALPRSMPHQGSRTTHKGGTPRSYTPAERNTLLDPISYLMYTAMIPRS